MKLQLAISILKKHNDWRRGNGGDMVDVTELGMAIDVVVDWCDFQLNIINFAKDSKPLEGIELDALNKTSSRCLSKTPTNL